MARQNFIDSLKETLRQFKAEHQSIAKAVRDIEALLAGMTGSAQQKRRGRPPGKAAAAATKGKKRGRPPGSGKKRRGRPPGSKNKNTVAREATSGRKKVKKQGQRTWTPEQRKAAGERLAKARTAKAQVDPNGA